MAADFEKAHGVNPMSDPQALQDLILASEKAKRRLSDRNSAKIRLNAFGHQHIAQVTREEFEVVRAMAAKARDEQEALSAALADAVSRLEKLEKPARGSRKS